MALKRTFAIQRAQEKGHVENKVKADKYAKVRFDNKQYSTSPIFAGKQLWIRATAQEIIVMDEDWHEVIRHQRLYGKNKKQ